MADETILTIVTDIVSAHISHNSVKADELPGLIEAVYASITGLGAPEPVVEEKREPAVSIRSSVKADSITCLECGARQKMLKRHLGTHHNLTPAEYKARWGLGADYPLVTADYANKRRELALEIGLGRKPSGKAKAPVKPARKPRVAKPEPVAAEA